MLFTADMKTLISCQNRNTNISIPNSVTKIGDWAFAYCHSLQSVAIPNSVTTIGKRAFAYCDSLESIYVSKEAYDRILKLLGSGYKDKLKIED